MSEQISWRLNALRAYAALAVFIYHLSYLGYAGRALPTEVGRVGVLVFFLMSGYVIAYVAENKHRSLHHYLDARLARLISVFLPALLLTAACDALGRQFSASEYARYPDVYQAEAWLRLPFFLTFLFENSFISLRWFSNGPMWSIAYEFWYYVLFGVFTYVRGWQGVLLTIGALLLAGWKIMLLSPVWFAGVLLYRHQCWVIAVIGRHWRLFLGLALALIVGSLLPTIRSLIAAMNHWSSQRVGVGMHMYFLSDYVLTLPLALLVSTLIVPNRVWRSKPRWAAPIETFAKSSFSVYLYHVPLILMLRASGIYDPQSLVQTAVAGLVTLACCYLMATLTEHRKSAWLSWVQGSDNAALETTKEGQND